MNGEMKLRVSRFVRQYLNQYNVERVRILANRGDSLYVCAYLGSYLGKIYMRVQNEGDKFKVVSVERL